MKRRSVYTVDLLRIGGEGDFPCPSCGERISPDDPSEVHYRIVDVEEKEDLLEKLTVVCNRCRSIIHILGFEELLIAPS